MKHLPSKEDLCRKLLTVVDSISDGVFAVDMDWKITFLNKAAERITGFKAEEAIGKTCREIFRTDICDGNCALKRTMATEKPVINQPVCITNREGKLIPISISTALLRDQHGRIIGGVETFRDLDLVRQVQGEFEARYTYENMISRSRKMLEIFHLLPAIAQSGSTVLIEGESGTGKELIALAIHSLGSRKRGPFISINCGALPDTLLESELFGYAAGAFTDAKKDKKGRFALAEKGTLLLDEIGDVSSAMQVKLLRVLQEKTFEPLGSTQSVVADVRVVAATNRSLDKLVSEGQFREDLFYRINVIRISLPPLRERREDIPLLADHFVQRFNRLRQTNISGISSRALKLLMAYNYPGNIRELENIIEHAFVLSPGGVIKPEDLPENLQARGAIPIVEIASTMKEMESLFIMAALKRHNWNRTETAKDLAINPSTLYRKIKKLGLKIPLE
ncbi:MAG: sigma 54-interacting transcriptional regulator [candidate division Zixibacteria bacterium]|nr:sigma 54-interacting transcriptional regulator [candidate division Zixibacteria bacterium]